VNHLASIGWPTKNSPTLCGEIHRLLHDVTAAGGAIGWVDPPSRKESGEWLGSLFEDVLHGDAALCLAGLDGVSQGMGCWRRDNMKVHRKRAEISKVMVHPTARGRGLGRIITTALVADARDAEIETLHLSARGNNHLAIAIYNSLGFKEWGRLPNSIEVGNLRFDDVRMFLQFPFAVGVVPCGSSPVGLGSSQYYPEDVPLHLSLDPPNNV
jgi:ribosomal protein S18 acetylase RimI-like enzyme